MEAPRTRLPLAVERVLLAAGMAAIALITLANVVTRYLTDISLAFTEEYSVMLLVVVTFLGAALATATGRHIRIDWLTEKLSPSARRHAEVAGMAQLIFCFGLLAWYGGWMVWDEYRFEALSPGLGNPQWWYSIWLPLLSLLVMGRAAGRILRLLRGQPS